MHHCFRDPSTNVTAGKNRELLIHHYFLSAAPLISPTETSYHQQTHFPWTKAAVVWTFHFCCCAQILTTKLCWLRWKTKKTKNTLGQQHMDITSQTRCCCPLYSSDCHSAPTPATRYILNLWQVTLTEWKWQCMTLKNTKETVNKSLSLFSPISDILFCLIKVVVCNFFLVIFAKIVIMIWQ